MLSLISTSHAACWHTVEITIKKIINSMRCVNTSELSVVDKVMRNANNNEFWSKQCNNEFKRNRISRPKLLR